MSVISESSPCPWGCFRGQRRQDDRRFVFPMPVGVFPNASNSVSNSPRLPHARGGVSWLYLYMATKSQSSPCPWGCFSLVRTSRTVQGVFPMPVGVFPNYRPEGCSRRCLPHARGGVSDDSQVCEIVLASSPCPWGCFLGGFVLHLLQAVFPMPVGVFLTSFSPGHPHDRLPHARGGVSYESIRDGRLDPSSPCPWGCF